MNKSLGAVVVVAGWLASSPLCAQTVDHQIIAKTGDSAPGTSVVFGIGSSIGGFSGFAVPVLNDQGHAIFLGQVTGSGVVTSNDSGIWTNTGAGLELVARTGSSSPGVTGGTYALLGSPVLSTQGHSAYLSTITGTGVNGSNNQVLYSRSPSGTSQLVARLGSPATGVGVNINYGAMTVPLIRPDGTVAFTSGLSGSGTNASNNSAILWGAPGSVQVLAREGSTAPGTGSALFDQFPLMLSTC